MINQQLLKKLKKEIKFIQRLTDDDISFYLFCFDLSLFIVMLITFYVIGFKVAIVSVIILMLIGADKILNDLRRKNMETAIDFLLRVKGKISKQEYDCLYDFIEKYRLFNLKIDYCLNNFMEIFLMGGLEPDLSKTIEDFEEETAKKILLANIFRYYGKC